MDMSTRAAKRKRRDADRFLDALAARYEKTPSGASATTAGDAEAAGDPDRPVVTGRPANTAEETRR